MLGSSFFDMVIGVDLHWEMVPTPAPVPTPFPNPFIGFVFDPMGVVAGAAVGAVMSAVTGAPFAGPVLYYTAFPATNTGTEAKSMVPHILIPPGVSWAPMPKTPKPVIHPGETPTPPKPVVPDNDAVAITGSKTVLVGGSNACRLGDIMLSCSEPLRLPSSLIVAIPKGMPILIGGPPSLDVMAAVMASLRTRFVSDSLHALVSRIKNARLRNLLNKVVCFFTGHPVDVATGKVVTEFVDADLPGPMPLRVVREYSSAFGSRAGPLGCGWSWSLDQGIWRERGRVVLLAEDGREIEFDTFDLPDHAIRPGQEIRHPLERLTLRCLDAGRWEVVAPDGSVREFAPVPGRADGRAMIRRERSFCGNHQHVYEYDKQGRLAWVQDSGGRWIGLESDAQGRVVALKLPHPDAEGWVVHRRYTYDDQGDLVQVRDALDASWSFEYLTHLLTRETDRNGLSFYFLYDGLGDDAWCIRTWGDGGIYDHSIQYDKKNKITFVTNSLGHTTRYHMNMVGLVTKIVDARGGVTRYDYNPETLSKIAEVDPLGRETRFAYDPDGNTVETVRPDAVLIRVQYGMFGRPARAWDANGGEWSWRHDAQGRMIAQTDPLGHSTSYRYEGKFLAEIMDPGGALTQVKHDLAGNLVASKHPNGGRRRWSYDRRGQVVVDLDPKGNEMRVVRDLEGRILRVYDPDGNVRALELDPEGNVRRARDVHHDIVFTHGGRNRLTSRTEAGAEVRFDYDTEGALVALTNEHGFVYRFSYDPNGDLVEEVDFDGLRRLFSCDLAGQVTKVNLPEGRFTAYTYDLMGLVTKIAYHDGTEDRFAWRVDGALHSAENEAARVTWTRDALGRVLRETQGEDHVDSVYDLHGSRVALSSSLGAEQVIMRDAMGDVLAIDAGQGRFVARFERDLLGYEIRLVIPGKVESRWDRDTVGRPLRHVVTGSGGQVHRDVSYTWAPDLRLRRTRDARRGPTEYGHDARGGLAWTKYADDTVEIRNPDAVANLFRTWDRSDRKYGAAGQILEAMTEDGLVRYAYDALGNLVRKIEPLGQVWTYTWDARGMLREVTRPDGTVVTFTYDPIARRISKSYRGLTTRWVWDGDVPLHEWVEGALEPKPVRTFPPVWTEMESARQREAELEGYLTRRANDRGRMMNWVFDSTQLMPLGRLSPTEVTSIICDHVGVPAFVEPGSSPTENPITSTKAPDARAGDIPFGWVGQAFDPETRLSYNRFRHFSPEVDAYVQRDPIGLHGGLSLYSYVHDPLAWADPFGLIAAPASLPSSPGIYIIQAGGESYVGSSVNMNARVSTLTHQSAQSLLQQSDAVVRYVPVDLGSATSRTDINRILRHFEQQQITRLGGVDNLLNAVNAEAASKASRNASIVNNRGASADKEKTCT